jgi:hypothetical protein
MKTSRVQQALKILNSSAEEINIDGPSNKRKKPPRPSPRESKKVNLKPGKKTTSR